MECLYQAKWASECSCLCVYMYEVLIFACFYDVPIRLWTVFACGNGTTAFSLIANNWLCYSSMSILECFECFHFANYWKIWENKTNKCTNLFKTDNICFIVGSTLKVCSVCPVLPASLDCYSSLPSSILSNVHRHVVIIYCLTYLRFDG